AKCCFITAILITREISASVAPVDGLAAPKYRPIQIVVVLLLLVEFLFLSKALSLYSAGQSVLHLGTIHQCFQD
ncbi:hypothetical protein CJF42_13740, partial [Pseudoalteromonas sp. NBT06-2]